MRKIIKWETGKLHRSGGRPDLQAWVYFEENGQALVEYVLMLAVSLSIVAAIGYGFKNALVKLWGIYHKEISSPCPACPPNNPGYRFR